tara:strand:+ start:728 stop:871 length:144 start_codon:yes stop_codon:yes gene_type:complete
MINSFDAYELLNQDEREQVNEIILEALSRAKYDINNIDYEIKTTLIS